MRRAACLLAVVLAATGCESTQHKSARLARQGAKSFTATGLHVRHRNARVKVVATQALQDTNGAAAVVVLRSSAAAGLRGVPIGLVVRGRGGKVLFKNDDPGLEPSLTGPSVLPAGREFAWVNDQVVADSKVAKVDAIAGEEKDQVRKALPKLQLSKARLQGDPTSGIEATGTVTNRSQVEQHDLVLYCVARHGSRIVAAGRGEVPRLKAGRRRTFHIFFIGDPRGAALSIEAPPTSL